MKKIDVSIVVLNYNTATLLAELVKSVVKYTKEINYELIIVDNASDEPQSKALLAKLLVDPKIKVIKNNQNYGFAKGNNIGIQVAKGEFVLLLNSDTYFSGNVLKPFIAWLRKNPKIGIASVALKNQDGSLQGTGGYFPTLIRVWSWMLFLDDIPFFDALVKPFHPWHARSFYKNAKFFEKKQMVDWLTGAFFMIRKDVIEQAGLLDEEYFMYVEDLDYCFRVKKNGWKIVYNPNYSIVHLGGKSSKQDFPIISEFKALKLFYKKHYPSWQGKFLTPAFKLGCLLRVVLFNLMNKSDIAKIYEKAFVS